MKAGSVKHSTQQSAAEAIAVWEGASRNNKPVGADAHGNLTVVYGSAMDSFNQPSAHQDAAQQCLINKLKNESGPFLSLSNQVFSHVMHSRLPSLEQFMSSGKLGQLSSEWQALRSTLNTSKALPEAIEAKRNTEAKKMAELLPAGMQIDIHDEGLSLYTHTFSEASQDRLMMEMSLLAHEEMNKRLPLSNQFIKDVNRGNTYRIQTPRPLEVKDEAAPNDPKVSIKQAIISSPQLTPRAAEVVGKLYDFCDGDLSMMATLSCVLSQSSLNKMDDEDMKEMAGPSGFRPILNARKTLTSTAIIFEVSRDTHGNVITNLKNFTKASMMASGLPGEEWAFQPGPDSENATENNFNRRTTVSMSMKISDLRNGQILPDLKRKAETSYVFDFDWKRIDKN